MQLLRISFLMIVFLMFVVGCSTGGSGDIEDESGSADSVDADVVEEVEAKEEAGASDDEIPSGIPPNLYVPDDAEIQATFESDLQISFSYATTMTYEEIKEIYQDYLSDTSMFSEYSENLSEDAEIDYFAAHIFALFEGDPIDIEIKSDSDDEELLMVIVTLYNNEELEEMFED